MDIDPYAPCPGGTGKKLKFCCTDLTAELDKLSRMISGEQRAAALDYVDKLNDKYPDRPCLLSTKSMLESELGQPEKAAVTVAHFCEKFPDNPVALAEMAITRAQADAAEAVRLLQKAIENMPDKQLPMQLYDAAGVVALALLHANEVPAARAHWMLQFAWSAGKDEQPLQFMVQLLSSQEIHLLLKENWSIVEAPADALWKRSFDQWLQPARIGRWLAAADGFQALADKAGAWPAIEYNIAVLRTWLGERAAAVAAWRQYAYADVPWEDASEAEAVAQLLDPETVQGIDIVRVAYPFEDVESLLAQLASSQRLLRMPGDMRELTPEGEPPPKGYFALLDRPKPGADAVLTVDSVPQILGQVLVYGKQTDRPARLELLAARPDLQAAGAALREVAGKLIGDAQEEQVSGQLNAAEDVLSLKWYLPENTPPALRRELVRAGHRRQLLERWPALPLRLFDGHTAREVAADPKYRIKLLGAILILDLMGDTLDEQDFNELRRRLGLPQLEPVDPSQVSVLQMPFARLARLDVKKLSDHDLLLAFDRAQEVRFVPAMRRLGREILARPALDKELDKAPIYATLAQLESDPQRAVADLDEARKIAEAAGKSTAQYDLIDLTLRMSQGDVPAADRLLQHIRDEHLREPGIAQALYTLLSRWGIIRPDGSLTAEQQTPAPGIVVPGTAAEAPGKIWTPGSEPAAGGAGKKSAIWTPGLD